MNTYRAALSFMLTNEKCVCVRVCECAGGAHRRRRNRPRARRCAPSFPCHPSQRTSSHNTLLRWAPHRLDLSLGGVAPPTPLPPPFPLLGMCVPRWTQALELIDTMIAIFGRLNQPHNIHQMILSKVLIILYGGDLEPARRLFNSSVGYVGALVSPVPAPLHLRRPPFPFSPSHHVPTQSFSRILKRLPLFVCVWGGGVFWWLLSECLDSCPPRMASCARSCCMCVICTGVTPRPWAIPCRVHRCCAGLSCGRGGSVGLVDNWAV